MADITRKDWVAKTCEESVSVADVIFAKLNKASKYAYQPGYTNSFIGVRSGAKPCNFFVVTPQKKATVLSISVSQSVENDSVANKLSKSGIKYANGWYAISMTSADDIDLAIPILLQAEAEFKKEKGENALTLHTDMPAEPAVSDSSLEADAAKEEKEKTAAAPVTAAPVASKTSSNKGALNGLFSVAANKKVRFSMGNLQFNPKKYEFRFALHQYDVIGADNSKIAPNYDGWIDLFGYGTSGYMGLEPTETSNKATDYPMHDIANTNYDWGVYNPISNGGNKEGLWRTLTIAEWIYLCNGRPNATKLRAKARVNGVDGVVILPDDFFEHRVRVPFDSTPENFADNTYDLAQWAILEEAGTIFMPCGGSRKDNKTESWTSADYWSATGESRDYEYISAIRLIDNSKSGWYGYRGFPVRLVQDVK